MDEARLAYERWVDIREEQRASDFQAYAYNIAEARYVMRRVTRIANERAKKHDLDALLHQALLQIYGVGENEQLTVSKLAERLDELPDTVLHVHCGSGYRASIAASMLDALGKRVVLVDDSFENASAAGLTSDSVPA